MEPLCILNRANSIFFLEFAHFYSHALYPSSHCVRCIIYRKSHLSAPVFVLLLFSSTNVLLFFGNNPHAFPFGVYPLLQEDRYPERSRCGERLFGMLVRFMCSGVCVLFPKINLFMIVWEGFL